MQVQLLVETACWQPAGEDSLAVCFGEPAPWAFFNALIYKIAPCMGGPLFIEFHDFPGGPQRGSAGSARRRDANQPNAGTTAPSSLGLVARPNKAPSRRPQQVGPGKPNEAGFATCPRLRQHIPPAGYVMPAGYVKRRFNSPVASRRARASRPPARSAACGASSPRGGRPGRRSGRPCSAGTPASWRRRRCRRRSS